MRHQKNRIQYVFVSILSLMAVVFFIFYVDPFKNTNIGDFSLSPIIIFFILSTIFLFSLFEFFLGNLRISMLITGFIISLLLLQLIGFFNIYYATILLVIVGLIELGFRHK